MPAEVHLLVSNQGINLVIGSIAFKQVGFSVLDLREGTPREHFSSEEEFIRRQ